VVKSDPPIDLEHVDKISILSCLRAAIAISKEESPKSISAK